MFKIYTIAFLIIGMMAIYYIRKDKIRGVNKKMDDTDEDEKIAKARGMTLQEYNDEYGDGELMTNEEEKKVFKEWKAKKDKLQEQVEEQVEIFDD